MERIILILTTKRVSRKDEVFLENSFENFLSDFRNYDFLLERDIFVAFLFSITLLL